ELYDPVSGSWRATGSLNTTRQWPTATLLSNGMVLVAGGYNGVFLPSANLSDPVSGSCSATGSLNTAHYGHTATLLPDGKVLVAGGDTPGALTSAELYDPASVTVSALSGPWDPLSNPNLDYGIHDQGQPTILLIHAGQSVTLSAANGLVCADCCQQCVGPDGYQDPNGPFSPWVPANDRLGSSGTRFPYFILQEDWDVFLMQLVGAFGNEIGTVIGNPFKIGTATVTFLVPDGATQL